MHARILEDTLGRDPADGQKPRGVIHWVSAQQHLECEVRLYDRLFNEENPGTGGRDFLESLNPDSLIILQGCKAETGLANATLEDRYQFERQGYFCLDSRYTAEAKPVFNRTIGLKDSWAKISAEA